MRPRASTPVVRLGPARSAYAAASGARARSIRVAPVALLGAAAVGCLQISGLDAMFIATGGPAGSGGIAGGGASTGGAGGGGGCPSCGPLQECASNRFCASVLVVVPLPGGGSMGIDATEVTRAQYQAWLATNPPTDGQDSWCSWNTDYAPFGQCSLPPGDIQQHPVACVDWCDAFAYCRAMGKRLCGRIGGGPLSYADATDPERSQWQAACTAGGLNGYPYGDEYAAAACNGADQGVGNTVPVATLAGCQASTAGYAGVYDLSGNVWEWEDACYGKAGDYDLCSLRGGSFHDTDPVALACGFDAYLRSDRFTDTGFRCCSEP